MTTPARDWVSIHVFSFDAHTEQSKEKDQEDNREKNEDGHAMK